MSFAELVQHYWVFLAALTSFGVWLVRIESKVTGLEKENTRRDGQHEAENNRRDRQRTEDLLAAKESRVETSSRLGRIEDLLNQLLQKSHS